MQKQNKMSGLCYYRICFNVSNVCGIDAHTNQEDSGTSNYVTCIVTDM